MKQLVAVMLLVVLLLPMYAGIRTIARRAAKDDDRPDTGPAD